MLAQQTDEIVLHHDAGPSGFHRSGVALKDPNVGAYTAKDDTGAQTADRAPRDCDPQRVVAAHDRGAALRSCVSIRSGRCAPEKAGMPLITNVGILETPPRRAVTLHS